MRENIFGIGSKRCRIAYPMQFSDDIVTVAISLPNMHETINHCVNKVGKVMGISWVEDKYEANIHIGYEYRLDDTRPSQHIKSSKIYEYSQSWAEFIQTDFHPLTMGDQIAGQMNHAATIDVHIKPLTKSLINARHVKTSGLKQPIFHISAEVKKDIHEATRIITRNRGIPMMCDTS